MLVGGLLLGLAFPPLPAFPLALVALVPLLVRWSRAQRGWMLFREAYSAFLLMTAVAGHWVLFHQDTLTALVSGVGLLLLPLPLSLAVAGSGVLRRRYGQAAGALALVAFALTAEFIVTHGPIRLPWLLLGNTLASAGLVNQFADVAGVPGLSLWVWLVNALLFGALSTRDLALRLAVGLGWAALLLAPLGYAQWRLPLARSAEAPLHVGIVQPALDPEAWRAPRSGARVDLLADISEGGFLRREQPASGGARPSLLVWPETALPALPDARQQRLLYARLKGWTAQHGVALLTGAVTRYDSAPSLTVEPIVARQAAETTPFYNSALLFRAADPPQQYDKVHLVPLAERLPLVSWRPALAAIGAASGTPTAFASGRGRTVFHVDGRAFGTLISSEGLFGEQARGLVEGGAGFLVVLSQDGWWGRSAGYRQLFELARLRAVETRRPVVMAAVSGRSGLIAPDGAVLASTAWMEQAALSLDVPSAEAETLYVRRGDWLGRLALALSALLGLAWGIAAAFFPAWPARR